MVDTETEVPQGVDQFSTNAMLDEPLGSTDETVERDST